MKKINYKYKFIISILVTIPFVSFASHASHHSPLVPERLKNPTTYDSFPQLLEAILTNVVTPIATIVITIMIVFYGLKLVMSQGKPTEIANAKNMLKYALVGAFVILSANAILKVITATVSEF